jgi:hypothetical protein
MQGRVSHDLVRRNVGADRLLPRDRPSETKRSAKRRGRSRLSPARPSPGERASHKLAVRLASVPARSRRKEAVVEMFAPSARFIRLRRAVPSRLALESAACQCRLARETVRGRPGFVTASNPVDFGSPLACAPRRYWVCRQAAPGASIHAAPGITCLEIAIACGLQGRLRAGFEESRCRRR